VAQVDDLGLAPVAPELLAGPLDDLARPHAVAHRPRGPAGRFAGPAGPIFCPHSGISASAGPPAWLPA
jgi:hypothetical protein